MCFVATKTMRSSPNDCLEFLGVLYIGILKLKIIYFTYGPKYTRLINEIYDKYARRQKRKVVRFSNKCSKIWYNFMGNFRQNKNLKLIILIITTKLGYK